MSVAATCGERRCAEASAHLSATGYHGRGLIEADVRVQAFNGFKLELTGTNCIEQHGLADFSSAHHIDQHEIVGQNSIQSFNIAIEQSDKEPPLSRKRPRIIVHLRPPNHQAALTRAGLRFPGLVLTISSTDVRSNSATLQACASQPPARWGASPSKTSGICPRPSSSMNRRNSASHCSAC